MLPPPQICFRWGRGFMSQIRSLLLFLLEPPFSDSLPHPSVLVFSGQTWLLSSHSSRYRARCERSNIWHICVLYYSVVSIDRIPFLFLFFIFKAIESLTQKLHDIERERQSQQLHIQTLQGNLLHHDCLPLFKLGHVIPSQQHWTPVIVN